MATYGYARVSSRDQNEQRQIDALTACGVEKANIFLDKQSGKDFEREQYQIMLNKLQTGDTLIIKSIDRLGRNYDGILEQWRELTEKGIGIIVLDMPLLNTAKDRDLTGRLISDIVLQLLSYVAETERTFIKKRQAEGIAAAKARGVHFGRVAQEKPEIFYTAYQDWKCGHIGSRVAAFDVGISHTTFLRWAREYEQSMI